MSGLEILGAVLGSIPLVISALEHYANGITTAKRYMAYRRELMDLIDKIATEEQIFGNTVKQLLTGIVDLERMEEIVPGSDLWRDSGIDLELKNRLCDGYHIYLQNVRGMEAALQRIRKKLALDPLGKPQFSDPSRFKVEIKRLKFSVQRAAYAEHFTALKDYNQALTQLTTQSISLESARGGVLKHRSCPNFNVLQNFARTLYETIQSGLRCSCDDHAVKLRLEKRDRRVSNFEDMRDASFRVIFTGSNDVLSLRPVHAESWKWTETNITCLPDDPPKLPEPPQTPLKSPRKVRFVYSDRERSSSDVTLVEGSNTPAIRTMPTQIDDLCKAVASLQTPHKTQQQSPCIGYLTDSSKRRYGIYPLESAITPEKPRWTVYSLRQILTEQTGNRRRLGLPDKLRVAIDLAYSVLHLYNTPWMDGQWSDNDVYFVHHHDVHTTSLYEHPFVYRRISAPKADRADNSNDRPAPYSVIRNETLFTLGILLIELLFGKSMEDLQLPCDLDCTGTPGVTWCTARRLLEKGELEFEVGPGYADIVRRCFWCEFHDGKSSLDDQELQRAVYEKVVVPLEGILHGLSMRFT